MPILDYSPIPPPTDTSKFVEVSLTDIVNQIEFSSDFCITHPEYQPWQLPQEIVTRYQQLPVDIQNQYLRMRLCDFLYGIYFDGSLKTGLALDANSEYTQENLDNKTYQELDSEFYQKIQDNNHGTGYFDSDWLVIREEGAQNLAVIKNGLTVYIKRDRHLSLTEQSAGVGELVNILLPSNHIESFYYIAIGNAGSQYLDQQTRLVSIYFNLSSDGAVVVMDSLTKQLNALALPFSFKVLYNPAYYHCYDSAILSFDRRDYQAIRPILQSVYAKHQSYFQPEVPLFTKILAPGLALAEAPEEKFFEQDNFGRNRCRIVTNGLLAAYQQGDASPQARMKEIRQEFSLMKIKLHHPYLNPNSEDIYKPLDLATHPIMITAN